MPPRRPSRALTSFVTLAALTLLASACRRPSTREWRADDHDRADDPRSPSGAQRGPAVAPAAPAVRPAPSGARPGPSGAVSAGPATPEATATLVEAAWRTQCAECHGLRGVGDGPRGPMVHAKDLTDAAWQSSVTDEHLGEDIREGKGKMPSFDLPAPVIAGLVRKIRSLRAP